MSNREQLLDKVRALLSKTRENGCTEAEEMAALAKARAMIDTYEIGDEELRLTKEESAIFRKEPPGSADPWHIKKDLAAACGKFSGCMAWRGHDGIVFCGLRSDVQFATWLVDHLAAFVMAEMVKFLADDLSSGGRRRSAQYSFAHGCTARISQRLKELCEQSQPQTSNSRALVVVKDQAIKDKMAKEGIRLHNVRRSRMVGGYGYAEGQAAGDRASFGRPVEGKGAVLRIGGR